jgi:hypothetical protein
MSVGTYFISVIDLEYTFCAELKYAQENEVYSESESVQISGKVKDKRNSSSLLIDGKTSLDNLAVFLTVERANDWPLQDPESKQTRRLEPFPKPAFITKTIGNLSFEPGRHERDLDIKIERGLYGHVCLNPRAFAKLWDCGVLGRKIQCLYIDVFGASMEQIPSYTGIIYHWNCSSADQSKDLLVCGFSFSFQ